MNNVHVPETITRIESGRVNCYLVKMGDEFVLVDSGYAKHRDAIEAALAEAGCEPGKLRLIVMTHGDFDHVGNSAYLRERYGCKLAMHHDDVGMVEHGDTFWNRDVSRATKVLGKLFTILMRIRLDEEDRFTPDLLLEDRQGLAEFGLDAIVHHLPGHSKGSIGLLTAGGAFFCGDLFTNVSKPKQADLVSNRESYAKSLKVTKELDIQTVYPGHGIPFSMDALSIIFQEED